jgi:hypothetical protein
MEASVVLEADTFGAFQDEAKDMRIRAEMGRTIFNRNSEGAPVMAIDKEGNADMGEEGGSYDMLVHGVFRWNDSCLEFVQPGLSMRTWMAHPNICNNNDWFTEFVFMDFRLLTIPRLFD